MTQVNPLAIAEATATLTDANDACPASGAFRPQRGGFNISLSGTWTGTVKLQRAFDDDASPNWLDVASYTANTETAEGVFEAGLLYRLVFSTATSGSVSARLSQ